MHKNYIKFDILIILTVRTETCTFSFVFWIPDFAARKKKKICIFLPYSSNSYKWKYVRREFKFKINMNVKGCLQMFRKISELFNSDWKCTDYLFFYFYFCYFLIISKRWYKRIIYHHLIMYFIASSALFSYRLLVFITLVTRNKWLSMYYVFLFSFWFPLRNINILLDHFESTWRIHFYKPPVRSMMLAIIVFYFVYHKFRKILRFNSF